MTNTGKATLSFDSKDESRISRGELATIPTPEPVGRWNPVAHEAVPQLIEHQIADRGWKFRNEGTERFQFAVNKARTRMFGVTEIIIPGATEDEEYGLAVGFRNSHDKTMVLRIAMGINVFVCSNMVMQGDVQIKRRHTINIDPYAMVTEAFDQMPQVTGSMQGYYNSLRQITIGYHESISLLTDAVEYDALSIRGLMDARQLLTNAQEGDTTDINHAGTLWAVYQSITAQYKSDRLINNPVYSANLHKLFTNVLEAREADARMHYSTPII